MKYFESGCWIVQIRCDKDYYLIFRLAIDLFLFFHNFEKSSIFD